MIEGKYTPDSLECVGEKKNLHTFLPPPQDTNISLFYFPPKQRGKQELTFCEILFYNKE